MNDELLALIAKWASAEAAPLPPGKYEIDSRVVRLIISGSISVGEPTEYTPTPSIPLLTAMAVLLHRMGFQREAASTLLVESLSEAIELGEKADGVIGERIADIESAMEHVRRITAALPKKVRRGATRIKDLEVEILADEEDRLAG